MSIRVDVSPPEITCIVDARELVCPLPVLKSQRQLRSMQSGELLQLLTTDPASARDVPDFCREAGHTLVSQEQDATGYIFVIRKT